MIVTSSAAEDAAARDAEMLAGCLERILAEDNRPDSGTAGSVVEPERLDSGRVGVTAGGQSGPGTSSVSVDRPDSGHAKTSAHAVGAIQDTSRVNIFL